MSFILQELKLNQCSIAITIVTIEMFNAYHSTPNQYILVTNQIVIKTQFNWGCENQYT